MPQLKSGRHVALSISPYLDALTAGSDESKYFAILALRLSANSPQALLYQVVIGYFREGQGTPPDAPSYPSGYCVGDVLEGRSDWSPGRIVRVPAASVCERLVPMARQNMPLSQRCHAA